MEQETIDNGECPYCGVFVQFVATGTITVVPDGSATATGYLCPRPLCKKGHIVMNEQGQWRRFPLRSPADIPGVPKSVMQVYREAVLSLGAGAPRAAACMIRRTVASTLTDQEIPDAEDGRRLSLQERIDRIKDRLLPATYSAARAARLLGDAGAHEEAEDRLGEIDEETVRRTIRVVRQFLGNLYELPHEVDQIDIAQTTTS